MLFLDILREESTSQRQMKTVNKKVLKAFEHGITPIMCCGETLDTERTGRYN